MGPASPTRTCRSCSTASTARRPRVAAPDPAWGSRSCARRRRRTAAASTRTARRAAARSCAWRSHEAHRFVSGGFQAGRAPWAPTRRERSPMTLRPLAAALLAVAALGVAACGDDAETPTANAAADDDKVRQAQVKFAECMRENGVDMPDPKAEGGKSLFKVGGDSGISPEEFEKASKACEKYREGIRPNLSEEEQAEFKEKALEHARCMREHGIDMPDPTFNADGGAEVRIGPGSSGGRLDPEDPEFQAAEKECGGGLMQRSQK